MYAGSVSVFLLHYLAFRDQDEVLGDFLHYTSLSVALNYLVVRSLEHNFVLPLCPHILFSKRLKLGFQSFLIFI